MPANAAFAPLALQQFTKEDFASDDGVAMLNQHLSLLTQRLNAVQGNVGKVAFPAGVDMAGQAIENVNGVGPQHAAISHAQAEARYSAAALSPQLEAGQPTSLRSMRRLNDPTQTENHSNFMEGMLSTSPTTSTSTITGSGSTVTVSAGYHLRPSGNIVPYAARTDTVSLSPTVSILTLVRASSIVTATTSGPHGLTPGAVITITSAIDPTFDGQFVVASTPTTTTFTYAQIAANASTTGGAVSEGSVFYYFLAANQKTLSLVGPFGSDSQQNRLSANRDGTVLIAVASFSGGEFNAAESAAGTTPPVANGGSYVLHRL
jgi:hypothetical protein